MKDMLEVGLISFDGGAVELWAAPGGVDHAEIVKRACQALMKVMHREEGIRAINKLKLGLL